MKYINGNDVFPPDLLDLIQDYTQGKYVYIPKRDENKEKWGTKTSYRKELEMRNSHIYTKYLTGLTVEQLVNNYCLSAKSIRRILLEKRKGAEEMKKKLQELLSLWNINGEMQQIYDSAWSVGEAYVMKTNDNLGGLKRNIIMMKTLEECGIPVAKIIPTVDGMDYIEHDGRYYLMMNKLSGVHILDIYEEDYKNIAYKTGKIVAKLHIAFIACEQKITLWNNSLLDEMNGWIYKSLKENQFRYITELDFETSLNELKDCYDKLPRQLIHRDMHFGNIIFDKGEFSGYLDFDLSQKNVRIFDICYFLMGLLINHEKKKEDAEKWYQIISKFIEGYEVTNPLTKLEKDSIVCLMGSIELLFLAYFLSKEDEILAEGAANLYYFVRKNEKKIQTAVYNSSYSTGEVEESV